ncbi:hypothetical protein ACSQ67_026129 [Phaseolus vulgaris]
MRELPSSKHHWDTLLILAQAEGTHVDAPGGGEAVTTDQVRREPHGSVMTFPSTCGACAASCETRMFVTNIPYFQEVIVMASTCDACGYRNSELKPGGRIPEKGKIITLSVKNVNDLSRDVIKSDTASVKVPEVDLELASGTLGGIVTTVEGLERVHGFTFGDSLDENSRSKWIDFKARLNKLLSLEEPWTLILDDALANSFVAPATDDPKEDNQLACKISNSDIKLYFEQIKFTFSRVEILNSISMMPILFLYIWKVETSIFCSLKYLIRFNYRSCWGSRVQYRPSCK